MTSAVTTKPESAPALPAIRMYHFPPKHRGLVPDPSRPGAAPPGWGRGQPPHVPTAPRGAGPGQETGFSAGAHASQPCPPRGHPSCGLPAPACPGPLPPQTQARGSPQPFPRGWARLGVSKCVELENAFKTDFCLSHLDLFITT